MAFTVTLGSVSISYNPATQLDLVVAHPASAAAVYATFVENVVEDGLVKTIFDAFSPVANKDVPASAKVPWPTAYGTTDSPYGTPANPDTGVRAVALVDDADNGVTRWTNAIRQAASSRKSWLDHYAELAFAIATGIKQALETNFRTGRVLVPASSGPGDPGTVDIVLPNSGEVFLSVELAANSPYVSSHDVNGFTIASDLSVPSLVSWLVVG